MKRCNFKNIDYQQNKKSPYIFGFFYFGHLSKNQKFHFLNTEVSGYYIISYWKSKICNF